VGGGTELTNNEIVNVIGESFKAKKYCKKYSINYIKDRAGHDFRYSIDISKIENELGWKPKYTFDEGMELTIGSIKFKQKENK
jgi:dTDP-glucose 4,6-dehydratase